jgi:phosphatidylglycerophosphate synthase
MALFGLLVDIMAGNGPMLSSLLTGISFARLFLKLLENGDSQLQTLPNLVTAIRIMGVVGTAIWCLHFGNRDEPSSFVLSDTSCAFLGSLFVALDFLDGFLARQLQQATALGAHLDAQADALGTAFLALTLRSKGRMSSVLALHMAAAAYLFPMVKRVVPKTLARRTRHAKEPWARPCAGVMGLCAVFAVALPVIQTGIVGDVSQVDATAGSLTAAAGWCAQAAGTVNAVSFFLSYLTIFGVAIPGNQVKNDLSLD